jgi:hypothetical protein
VGALRKDMDYADVPQAKPIDVASSQGNEVRYFDLAPFANRIGRQIRNKRAAVCLFSCRSQREETLVVFKVG